MREVLGLKAETGARKDEMGNLEAMVHVGTKRNSSAKELVFYSGVLLLFCVSFILR